MGFFQQAARHHAQQALSDQTANNFGRLSPEKGDCKAFYRALLTHAEIA
jgi:hypothetical protein